MPKRSRSSSDLLPDDIPQPRTLRVATYMRCSSSDPAGATQSLDAQAAMLRAFVESHMPDLLDVAVYADEAPDTGRRSLSSKP